MLRRTFALVGLALGVAVALPANAAAAGTSNSQIHIEPDLTFQRGEEVTASYADCAGNQLVRVWLSSDRGRLSTLVGYVVTDKNGRFTAEFEVPWATALGTARVVVDCLNPRGGNQHGSAVIEIVATASLAPLSPSSPLTPLAPSTPLTPLQPLGEVPTLTPIPAPEVTDPLAHTGIPRSAQVAAVIAGLSLVLGAGALLLQRPLLEAQANRRRRSMDPTAPLDQRRRKVR